MLQRTDNRQMLRGHPLFAAFDEQQFERLVGGAQLVHVKAGEFLFQRGDPARAFFVLIHGQLTLCMQSRAGEEKILAVIRPGKSFAEAVMFMQAPMYPVDARAQEDSALISVPGREFLAALRESPDTCFKLLAIMSQHLQQQVQEIEELSLESACNRLVRHFLRRAEKDTDGRLRIHLDEKKQDLAARLSIKPETLSRLLKSLGEAGLIEADGRDFVIPDLLRLQQHEI